MNSFIKFTKGMLFVLMLVGAVSSHAQQGSKGGGSPGPFEDANTHAELADGETYYLKGTVVMDLDEKDLFLEIDFKDHPWLANKRRIKSPFYRIENTNKFNMGKYVGKKVQLNYKAKLEFYEDDRTDKLSVDIALKPLSTPKVLRQ